MPNAQWCFYYYFEILSNSKMPWLRNAGYIPVPSQSSDTLSSEHKLFCHLNTSNDVQYAQNNFLYIKRFLEIFLCFHATNKKSTGEATDCFNRVFHARFFECFFYWISQKVQLVYEVKKWKIIMQLTEKWQMIVVTLSSTIFQSIA